MAHDCDCPSVALSYVSTPLDAPRPSLFFQPTQCIMTIDQRLSHPLLNTTSSLHPLPLPHVGPYPIPPLHPRISGTAQAQPSSGGQHRW